MSHKKGQRVVVAMSGGVDSSVAAALLVEQGYDVIGIMMRLWSEPDPTAENKCCSLEAVDDARRVAYGLGIPFYLLNFERVFKQWVVDFFTREYAAGRTPNPCLACNRHIRFRFLLQHALSLGATAMATGHYARVDQVDGRYRLLKGVDAAKDQSYVLHMLTQRELPHVMFPIGGYTKPEVRRMAEARGLPVASKHDSMELCFLADNNYRRFLHEHAPDALAPGPIVSAAGETLGAHGGLPLYTIGQRKGLGIAAGEPLYVVGTDAARNAVIVGDASHLYRERFVVRDVSWTNGAPDAPMAAEIKVRYKATPTPGVVTPLPDGRVEVALAEPQRAITPGQGAVFYEGDAVLGGGIIDDDAERSADFSRPSEVERSADFSRLPPVSA
ncbi:MAG: tRNA 2-thiouridine(34) synthase MnmA [Anaerolineae bacterium]